MEIRPYTESDWDAIRQIYDLSKPDELRGLVEPDAIPSLEDDSSMLRLFHDSTIFVAAEGDQVVGFGGHKDNYISWLFIHPLHRRNGLARALVTHIIGRLTGPIILNVAATNYAARRLYADLGFTVAKEFSGSFNGHDVQVVTLSLQTTD